ncbi:uncharacterized protein LACBIDRAFT_310633 [Laccaria bicolor S238N-H82]|uniref:Predicted protein n=1 Tax=Laccaria bicolor (strain S238N-H82 / ATCC MYA-4686) TaxID=486041 RepID=B0DUS2_LACBS|nr:uncharacterized protein LACBIDRAFT_310633 [Laccaria bicolor S238N-H82]EDR01593.1 predicted protein [Laccaria bicolor S238N-H82]|eukprot:XP_001887669.1 predicted protein [Laccaria bicolor S238N-H82]
MSKYNHFKNLFSNPKSSSGSRERQKQWVNTLGNPVCFFFFRFRFRCKVDVVHCIRYANTVLRTQ